VTSLVVTGSLGGIGRAVCALLVDEGWNVIGLDIEAVVEDCSWDQRVCDLASPASLAEAVQKLPSDVGAIVHLAAVQPLLRAQEIGPDEWQRAWSVNVAALQYLVASNFDGLVSNAPSRVIAVGSVHASQTSSGMAPYSVTKAALAAYVRALSIDGAQCGLTAIGVELGATRSPKLDQGLARSESPETALAKLEGALPTRRLIEPVEVAELVDWLLSSSARHMTGSSVPFGGGVEVLLATEVGLGANEREVQTLELDSSTEIVGSAHTAIKGDLP